MGSLPKVNPERRSHPTMPEFNTIAIILLVALLLLWNLDFLATLLNLEVADASWQQTMENWLEGYRRVISLPDAHVAMLPALIMARHLISLGWVHTRRETETAYSFTGPLIEIALAWSDRYLGS